MEKNDNREQKLTEAEVTEAITTLAQKVRWLKELDLAIEKIERKHTAMFIRKIEFHFNGTSKSDVLSFLPETIGSDVFDETISNILDTFKKARKKLAETLVEEYVHQTK